MIRISKQKRLLTFTGADGKEVFRCPVSLGSSPVGHKKREGDGKTPEGSYRICTVNRQSRFHIALGISYPSTADAEAALNDGRISRLAYLRIALMQRLGLRPPWRTPLGGYVMVHGEDPGGRKGDWTAGCVALTNPDIEKLASLCGKGETVIIES